MSLTFHQISYSNIALIKYWGKKNDQEPLNPSLSCTLTKSMTAMQGSFRFEKSHELVLDHFFFHEQENVIFKNKINTKLKALLAKNSWMEGIHFDLNTRNTFPHSSGIASSASSMSCLALVLGDFYRAKYDKSLNNNELSSLARELSGSASRSVQRGWNLWGRTPEIAESSDQHAVSVTDQLHENFQDVQDFILIVNQNEKETSSTQGHLLAGDHPEISQRIVRANDRLKRLMIALRVGDWSSFTEVIEAEALDLHTLMMTGKNPFCLLEAKSLEVIKRVIEVRNTHQLICAYTLDAGPNIHLLFPKSQTEKIQKFLMPKILPLIEYFIEDEFSQ